MKISKSRHSINLKLSDIEWEAFGKLAHWRGTSRTEIIRAFISDVTEESHNSHAYDKAIEYVDSGTWKRKAV